MLRLVTFGGLGIEPDDGLTAPRLRPPRLALLAVLAAAGDRGVSRDRLAGFFWPEADEARAAHSLRQARYALRQDLGCEVIRTAGSTLVFDEALMSSDVAEFRAALSAGDRARAVALIRGPFLDGFYLPGAPAFERWAEEERGYLSASTTAALLFLAAEATRSGDRDAAVEWWRQLTVRDPLSGRFAVGYLKALATRGDRAEGLAFARQHEATVRRELETDPDPEVRRIEAELRSLSSPDVERPHIESTPVSIAARSDITPSTSIDNSTETSKLRAAAQVRPRVRRAFVLMAASALTIAVSAAVARQRGWLGRSDSTPILAVGFIREDAVSDSQRVGHVLTDMLATNLARVEGLSVLANTRLLELVHPGHDSATGLADAARRAGATDLLEGTLRIVAPSTFALEMRRVDLHTGIVKGVYRVSAPDQYSLVDSATLAMTRELRLSTPASSIAHAMTTSATAYRLYVEGLKAYYLYDIKSALRLMHASLAEDSTFAMAAYYEVQAAAQLGYILPDGRHVTDARRSVLRLAGRAPERERLTITANLLADDWEPRALAVAESLARKYPDDPRAFTTLANIRVQRGDRPGAAAAAERAIAMDSVAESKEEPNCVLCRDYALLCDAYIWADSLAAAERTVRRYLKARPGGWQPSYIAAIVAARRGDSAAAYAAYRRLSSENDNRHLKLRLDLTLDAFETVEREVQPMLSSSVPNEFVTASWAYVIALRNQGRIREATILHRTGALPGFSTLAVQHTPDGINQAVLAIERGEPRVAAEVFGKQVRADMSQWAPGYAARLLAWNATLQGMALAAAGDTLAVRALADSAERWGNASSYGRDRRAFHYLRGIVLAAAGHDEDAARELAAAISSPGLGFTRVNYELGKALLRLHRPAEAIAALQPALRGEIDASNLYVTRTELHEVLARAFDAAGQRDSATAHYSAVVRAWRRADPVYRARRDSAQARLRGR